MSNFSLHPHGPPARLHLRRGVCCAWSDLVGNEVRQLLLVLSLGRQFAQVLRVDEHMARAAHGTIAEAIRTEATAVAHACTKSNDGHTRSEAAERLSEDGAV